MFEVTVTFKKGDETVTEVAAGNKRWLALAAVESLTYSYKLDGYEVVTVGKARKVGV